MTVCKAIRRGSRRRGPQPASFWLAAGLAAAVAGGGPCAVAQGGATATAAQSQQREPQPLRLTDVDLPQGFIGLPFYTSVAATGGSGLYSVLISGELPPGMRFARGAGVVAVGGVPTAEGTYDFTVAVTDIAQGGSVSHTYTVRIQPHLLEPRQSSACVPSAEKVCVADTEGFHFTDADSVFFPVKILDTEGFHFTDADSAYIPVMVSDVEGFHFTDTPSFSGPDQPGHPEGFHFGDSYIVTTSAVVSDLETFHFTDAASFSGPDQPGHPEGFHFGDSYIVTTSGTPTDSETFHFGDNAVVTTKVGISPATAPTGIYNTAYSQTFTAVGNTGTATFTPTGTLPTGLSFTTTTGQTKISGTPTVIGTFPFTLKVVDSGAGGTSTIAYSLVVNQASQSITIGTLPNVTYGAGTFGLSATASPSNLPVTITSTSAYVTGSNPFVPVAAGSATFQATQAGNTDYAAATPVNFNVTISPATLNVVATSITRLYDQPYPTNFGYSLTNFVNGDNASVVSGSPAFSTPTAATNPLLQAGGSSYGIHITQGTLAAANYTFAFTDGSVATLRAPQTITFYPLPNITHGTTFPLSARASSGLAVTYTVTGGSIANNILTVTASSGSLVTVTAAQSGNGNYTAATSVVRSFTAQ